jgi:hypothetical protein
VVDDSGDANVFIAGAGEGEEPVSGGAEVGAEGGFGEGGEEDEGGGDVLYIGYAGGVADHFGGLDAGGDGDGGVLVAGDEEGVVG